MKKEKQQKYLVGMPPSMHSKVDEIAKSKDRSFSYIVREALGSYLLNQTK